MKRLLDIVRSNIIGRFNMNTIKKPTEPKSWECCGDSCPNCVWTIYFYELDKYTKKNNKLNSIKTNKN